MPKDRWVVSDTHFGHANILKFVDNDGSRFRPFSSVEEMDELMIENWNKLIKPGDVVYHLGDVVINKRCIDTLKRCNGSKRLIMGNHDIFDHTLYLQYFTKIMAYRIFKDMILSHIPIHMSSLDRFKINLHGHIHCHSMNDVRYINCCVDYPGNNFSPLNLEDIRDGCKSIS